MASRVRKIHIPQPDGFTYCGYDYRAHDLPVLDLKRQSIESGTCRRCHQVDDARVVKAHREECAAAGIDPNTPWSP
jgi:hypothetical protein